MAFRGQIALADAAAGVGAIEHRQVLFLDIGCAFQGHRPAAKGVRRFDFLLAEAERLQHVEAEVVELIRAETQRFRAEFLAQGPFVERELDVEGAGERGFDGLDRLGREAFVGQTLVIDRGRVCQAAEADGVGDDAFDFPLVVAERAQRVGDGAVDDFEVAAAGELLELDQCEIRLDTGRVAVHDQTDRACRRDDRGLRVAVAVFFAERQRIVPGLDGCLDQCPIGAGLVIERRRCDAQIFIA